MKNLSKRITNPKVLRFYVVVLLLLVFAMPLLSVNILQSYAIAIVSFVVGIRCMVVINEIKLLEKGSVK